MNNNIEEDIKILQETNAGVLYFLNDEDCERYAKAIENILADRERLQEENDIYKEENQKITKALEFKEGTLNPDASIVIKSMKQALIQLHSKANKYDSLVEKIKDKKEAYNKNCTVINSFIVEVLQELLEEEEV